MKWWVYNYWLNRCEKFAAWLGLEPGLSEYRTKARLTELSDCLHIISPKLFIVLNRDILSRYIDNRLRMSQGYRAIWIKPWALLIHGIPLAAKYYMATKYESGPGPSKYSTEFKCLSNQAAYTLFPLNCEQFWTLTILNHECIFFISSEICNA
jgi:hypothetical protein